MKKKIWGNTIVKNEGRYVWFALMSVVDFLDKILVWDTGSSDNTVAVIEEVKKRKKGKIEFREIGEVDEKRFTLARQKMLEQSNCDWIFVLDGDEVWWENSIKKMVSMINNKGDDLDLIVTPFYNIVGDIYHHQEEEAGMYQLAGRKGHLNIRAVNRRIPGLFVDKPYGQEGFFDENGLRIQDRDAKRQLYLEAPYFHFSNISRSTDKKNDEKVMQRNKKIRHELGLIFPPNFIYPGVLYKDTPRFVTSPWKKMTRKFRLKAMVQTPLRKLKRRLK